MKALNSGWGAEAAALAVALCALLIGGEAPAQPAPREIVIAQVAPFSGAQMVTGKSIRAGIQLYFDHVNASGGINGAKIRFVSEDDGYRPPDTVRLIKELIGKARPTAFIASVGVANIDLLVKDGALVEAKIPLVGAVAGGSSMIGAPNIFVTKATHHDEVDVLFTILSTTGVKRVGIVYQDDPFGKDVLAGAEKAAAKSGVEIVLKAPYPRNTTDVKAAVEQTLKADPPVIYLISITTATIEFIKEYRGRGGAAQLYGLSVNDGPAIFAKLGPELARGFAYGTVVPAPGARNFAVVREYVDLASRAKLPDLGARSMEGFISAKVLVHALRKAKSPTSAALTQALSATRGLDVGSYVIDFQDPGHTGSRYVDFAILDGRGRVVQ